MDNYNIYLPSEYRDEMDCLTDEEFGRLIRFIFDYSKYGMDDTSVLIGNERFFANRVLHYEDFNRQRYLSRCKANAENGRLGGRPRKSASSG